MRRLDNRLRAIHATMIELAAKASMMNRGDDASTDSAGNYELASAFSANHFVISICQAGRITRPFTKCTIPAPSGLMLKRRPYLPCT
jgi:hypothetical protein